MTTGGELLLRRLLEDALAASPPKPVPPPAQRRSLDDLALDVVAHPARSTVQVVTAATLLFYAAERGHNAKVESIWDALVYVTTSLSVGYGDIFAKTPMGKIIGSALMTVGPALSGAALDGPHGRKADDKVEREILATLQEILARMPPAPGDREAG